ncbi:BQ2448_4341 [Microbotryum intermedium]|uniref:non-specific serine/threonine protein kinase n=1 Tax=Microbotryum intermedium TaxID=269621 RepID=A0A238FLR0_9BASI|nr:BQ2448_4341 [Microbotryum intermedium]
MALSLASVSTLKSPVVPPPNRAGFPSRSPPRSPRRGSTPPVVSGSSTDLHARNDSPSSAMSSNGRLSGVQSRRSTAVSLGLGVSFAPLVCDPTTSASFSRATSPNLVHSPSPQRAASPRSDSVQSSTSTRDHSRHDSFSATSGAAMPVGGTSTRSSSRMPSRRPSLTHLASFLSGIEHHARVRDPGPSGGRGVSRSASRSQSRAGERRPATEYNGDFDEEELDDIEDDPLSSVSGLASAISSSSRRRAGSRASSVAAASRRSSLNLSSERGSPHPFLHPLVRDNTTGGPSPSVKSPSTSNDGSSGWGRRHDLDDDDDDGSAWGDKTATPVSRDLANIRTFVPPITPRVLSTEMDEEPFLDTAPNSPHSTTKRVHSFSALGEAADPSVVSDGDLSTVDVFEEGERVGVDIWLEGRGGWVRDCFGSNSEGGPGNGIGGPKELEIERRLGEGTYAIVYLVREILYDPVAEDDDDILSPIDPMTSFQFDSIGSTVQSGSTRSRIQSWASDPFNAPAQPTYGKHFALKCLCKKDLTDDLIEVQRGEAILHRALPDHEYIVRLYGVSVKDSVPHRCKLLRSLTTRISVCPQAYETDDWLFLVLEYCPGRDLFYWLLESQNDDDVPGSLRASPRRRDRLLDDDDPEGALSRTITASTALDIIDATPPSPSLLSSTTNSHHSSRKRLRLISRMFGQMCQAVQACHDVGIAHRDIKPENFIVMDGRNDGDGLTGSRVVVKITDWGLGTREAECEDFDCGSKPYMAYGKSLIQLTLYWIRVLTSHASCHFTECRNNLAPTYDPRQADVWSLGLVLLNLLYHRNPWADPSLDDPDFAEYVQDGRIFLQNRFEGMSDEVATFLTIRVFCDVLEKAPNGEQRRRVSAGEFGRWASRLVIMLGGDQRPAGGNPFTAEIAASARSPAPSDNLFERLVATTPKSPLAGGLQSGGGSLLSQFAPRLSSISSGGPPPAVAAFASRLMDNLTMELREELPKVIEEPEKEASKDENKVPQVWQPPALSPSGFSDDESLPSPSFSPLVAPARLPHFPATPLVPLSPSFATTALPAPSPQAEKNDAAPQSTVHNIELPPLISRRTSPTHEEGTNDLTLASEDKDKSDSERGRPPIGMSEKPKRRKRGARKSKSARLAGDMSPPTDSTHTPGSPTGRLAAHERQDRVLQDLAWASQNLARELSKTPRSQSTHDHRPSRHTSSYQPSLSAASVRSSSAAINIVDPVAKKPVKSGGVFGRFKTLVTEGNPDLQAFKQRAAERDASIGAKADTYSAPAKMQGAARRHETPLSSRGSVGTQSWSSTRSIEGDDVVRGRLGATGEMAPGHWSSTSSRRERLDKQRRRTGEGDLSPSSSSRNGTATSVSSAAFDSRNNTPLSSFSSVNSDTFSSMHAHQAMQSVATVRDWRVASPRTTSVERPAYTTRSRAPTLETVRKSTKDSSDSPPRLVTETKPKLVDAATDTSDLVSPLLPASPTLSSTSNKTLGPSPLPALPITISKGRPSLVNPITRPWSANAATGRTNSASRASSVDVAAPTLAAPVASSPAPPVKAPTKLAKMLNSISVFNSRPASAGT